MVEGNLASRYTSGENYFVLPIHLSDMTATAYQLATDEDGAAFKEQAIARMEDQVTELAVKKMLSWITGEDSAEESDLTEVAETALESLETAAERAATESAATESVATETSVTESVAAGLDVLTEVSQTTSTSVSELGTALSVSLTENPLTWIKNIKKNGVLAIVMSEDVSQKTIDTSDTIGKRSLETGTMTVDDSLSVTQKVLFYLYIDTFFLDASESGATTESTATSEQSLERALDYELEYMIAGKAGDKENLTAVVRRLLLLREAANLTYLESDSQKRKEAAAIASVLSLVVGQPELEEVILQGVLAAWAYAESLSDVRILLEGGSVSLVKTSDQWHTELGSLSSSIYSTSGSEQTTGLTYANYLQMLLWTTGDDLVAQRAMDLIEKSADVKMDQMLARVNYTCEFQATALFWNFVTLGSATVGSYVFTTEATVSF